MGLGSVGREILCFLDEPVLDLGSVDAAAALDAEALRENHLEGFERKCVMPEDGEGARGETGGGSCGLSDARGGMAS